MAGGPGDCNTQLTAKTLSKPSPWSTFVRRQYQEMTRGQHTPHTWTPTSYLTGYVLLFQIYSFSSKHLAAIISYWWSTRVFDTGMRISSVESGGGVQAVPGPPPWVVWNGFCWARQCSQLSPRISLIINIRCQPGVWETLWLIFISRPPPDMRTQNRLTY